MRETILVSACLLGLPCRYDGKRVPCEKALELKDFAVLIPFCPECMGGLSTPRPPAELRDGLVINAEGLDVTAPYRSGAEQALQLCQAFGIRKAILNWEEQLADRRGAGIRQKGGRFFYLSFVDDPQALKEGNLYYMLAYAMLFNGEKATAKEYFEKSLALNPDNVKAELELSLL
jgi:hypothetical protein